MSMSSSEIEREVEASRANVEETVEALKDKMSLGQMVDEAARYFGNSGGGEMVSNLGAQVRSNPLPLLLIGAGMAWLMSGRGTPHVSLGRSSSSRSEDRDYGYAGEDYGSPSGFSSSGYAGSSSSYSGRGDYSRGTRSSVYAGSSHPDYASRSTGEDWSEGESSSGGSSMIGRAGEMLGSAGEATSHAVHGVRDAAGNLVDAAGNIVSGIASAASTVASAASRVGRTAYSAAESVAGGARVGAGAAYRGGSTAYRGASRMGSGVYRGASWAGSGAYEGASWLGSEAYEGASHLGYRARRTFSDVLETEPLVLAGVGLAVGAALGAMLPRTDIEDEYMGETRDRLREEAEEFAREKFEQGRAVANELYRTAKDEAEAQGLTTFDEDSVVGRVGQVARATLERARESAQEQGLMSTGGSGSESQDASGGGSSGASYSGGGSSGSGSDYTTGGTSGAGGYSSGGTSGSSDYSSGGTSGSGYSGTSSLGTQGTTDDDDTSDTGQGRNSAI